MCVAIYVYVYTYVCMYVCMYYLYMYIYIYVYVCVYIHTHVYVYGAFDAARRPRQGVREAQALILEKEKGSRLPMNPTLATGLDFTRASLLWSSICICICIYIYRCVYAMTARYTHNTHTHTHTHTHTLTHHRWATRRGSTSLRLFSYCI